MKIISDKEFQKLNNTVLTIGKFDGLHKGHQTLISKMKEYKKEGFTSVLFTFKKAPKEVLDMKESEYILAPSEKCAFLEKRGLDYYIEYPCDEEVLSTTAREFIERIIVGKIGAKKVVCGTDFRFGKGREGDIAMLKSLEREYGYETIVLDKLQYANADISSSWIREAVKDGNIEFANKLLGYTYTVIGKVVTGRKIGRNLGFPTANIIPDEKKLLPPNGVYYTKAYINGVLYKGVTNIGKKPTIDDNNDINIETCFLGYSGDLYGETMEIEFYKYVRSEMKFDSLQELKNQIEKDVKGCIDTDY